MIRSVLYLSPKDGDHDRLIEYFRDNRVLEVAADFPGCLAAELQIPQTPSAPALVTALWASTDDYAKWVSYPWRETSGTGIDAVLSDGEGGVGGDVYRVAIAVTSNSESTENAK